MIPARSPWRASGDTAPLGVQAGLPVSRFAEKTGFFSMVSRLASLPSLFRWLHVRGTSINDCGGVDSDTHARMVAGEVATCRIAMKAEVMTSLRSRVNPASRCNSGPQSPFSTLIAVLTVPAIAVAVGLVWSQL